MRRTVAAVIALAGLAGTACGSTPPPQLDADGPGSAIVDVAPDAGILWTVTVLNVGDSDVQLAALRLDADPGLSVRFLGVCPSGCGNGRLADTSEFEAHVTRHYPIVITRQDSPDHVADLLFEITVKGQAGAAALRQRCLRFVEAVGVMDDGSTIAIRSSHGGGFLVGLTAPAVNQPGYVGCDGVVQTPPQPWAIGTAPPGAQQTPVYRGVATPST